MSNTHEFSMNDPADRAALAKALQQIGLPAVDTEFSGVAAVSVALIEETDTEALSIDAIHDTAPCQVGLSGWRIDEKVNEGDPVDCLSVESCVPPSLEEAVISFQSYWERREGIVEKFRAGHYDVPEEDEEL